MDAAIGIGKGSVTFEDFDTGIVDHAFIGRHTDGYAAYAAALLHDDDDLAADVGVPLEMLEAAWELVRTSEHIIICWAMGVTQHRDAVATIRDIVNFALLTGSIGRRGAGLSPIRGHSNVQGDRTMGVWSTPKPEFLDRLAATFGFDPPRAPGLDAVGSVEANRDGKARLLINLGGNVARSFPDSEVTERALRAWRLTVGQPRRYRTARADSRRNRRRGRGRG